jgi:hypothetical protein
MNCHECKRIVHEHREWTYHHALLRGEIVYVHKECLENFLRKWRLM